MEQKIEDKIDIRSKFIRFYHSNKIKLIISCFILITIIIAIIIMKQIDKKKNISLAEKYVQAEILLSSNKNEKAKKLYEEIILSKNKFYSILALNTVIEKDLISDKKKIINYFSTLEKSSSSKDNKDLIILKKALYFLKESNTQESKKLLTNLVENNSNLKKIAQELLDK